jgi:hypothetical protein
MKAIVTFAVVLLTAGAGLAQNYYLATQQAKRVSGQNDAEQQRIQNEASGSAGAAAARTAAAPAAPADPAVQAALGNIAGLQSDFAALGGATGDKPDPAQKISLLNDLSQAAQGTKASAAAVKTLANDLSTAVAGKSKLTPAQQTRLAREVHALFNSSKLPAAQTPVVLADVQKILTDGGASLDAAVDVVTDLKTVVAETQ